MSEITKFIQALRSHLEKQPKPLISQQLIAKHDAATKGVIKTRWEK